MYFLLKILKNVTRNSAINNLTNILVSGLLANIGSAIPNQDQLGVGLSPLVYSVVGLVIYEGFIISKKGIRVNLST